MQVHLPRDTVATSLEATTLRSVSTYHECVSLSCFARLLQQLLSLNEVDFPGRIFTTGATASNILGMALGREFIVAEAGRRKSPPIRTSVAELGILEACFQAGVTNMQVLATLPHSSLYKATSAVGIGRDSVIVIPRSDSEPWKFDLDSLAKHLSAEAVSIISISAGEVSSGRFATNGKEMSQIRALADQYGAWIHIDGGSRRVRFFPSYFLLTSVQRLASKLWSFRIPMLIRRSTRVFLPFISRTRLPGTPTNY